MTDKAEIIPILPQSFDPSEPVMPIGYVKLCVGMLPDGGSWVIAPVTMIKAKDGPPTQIISFGIFPRSSMRPHTEPVERDGTNRMVSLDDLPLDDGEKVLVLEWFARKLWVILEEGSEEPDYYGKSYDPLVIDLAEKEAHSYVFHLDDGGRHHPFESLLELEEKLKQEGIRRVKELRGG